MKWLTTELQQDIWNKKYRYNNETLEEFFDRVSGGNLAIRKLISKGKFLFAGRVLANRGIDEVKSTLSNCVYIGMPEDNIESIFDTAKKLARTFSYGGGCGIDISKLAPKGAKVRNTAKYTSGAVSFMDLYSLVTSLIAQNGRRGALLIEMKDNHPDIEDFIDIKSDLNKVTKANISIKISDDFMKTVENDKDWELSFTRKETGETIKKVIRAKDLYRKFCKSNTDFAEPGCLFWDKISSWNMTCANYSEGGNNACSEMTFHTAGGICNLSSINLSEYVHKPFTNEAVFDFPSFEQDIKSITTAMNDILDEGMHKHALPEQTEYAKKWRPIGIGIMGLADMFIKMGLKYGSPESLNLSNEIGKVMLNSAVLQSSYLAEKYEPYPMYNKEKLLQNEFFRKNINLSVVDVVKEYGLRNSQFLSIAPTGSISTMLGVSGGIEPIFAISYQRKTETLHKKDKYYKVYTPIVKEYMEMFDIQNENDLPDYFITAHDLDYEQRINMQATWQRWVDNAISSTINLPKTTTVQEVEDLYMLAWKKGLKGLTIYRDGCKRSAILSTKKQLKRGEIIQAPSVSDGKTVKFKSGCGNVYLTITYDNEGNIIQTFIDRGASGGCSSHQQAISRLISLCIRGGINLKDIIDQLNSVSVCPAYRVEKIKNKNIGDGSSCPSAIANILKKFDKTMKIETDNYEKCPECGEKIDHAEGCISCYSCGYTKCK